MEGLLKDVLTSQPILQVFAGGIALIVVAYMVTRGAKDREAMPINQSLPAPAPGSLAEVPAIFAQGPQEVMNAVKSMKEDVKRMADNGSRVMEDIRDIKDVVHEMRNDGRRRVELLEKIEREQALNNRMARDREDRERDR